MWSTCGAASPGPLASSAARWRTPNRCCSSTTQTASEANRTSGSISAWVPTTSPSSPLASRPRVSRRRAAGVAPVSSANGIEGPRPARAARRASSRAARPASRSAPSAPPGDPTRARAASRTRRRPSFPSRPRPSAAAASAARRRGRRRSRRRRAAARRWARTAARRASARPARRAARGRSPAALAPGAAAHRERRLVQAELLEREPLAGALAPARASPGSGRSAARRATAAEAAPRPQLGGQRLDRVAGPGDRLPGPLAQPLRRELARSRCGPGRSRSCGAPARRRRGRAGATPPATISWAATRNPERSSLPLSSSRVPGRRRSAR